ncbi:hypothetical protein [Acidisoma sp. S159]|jgi:hypothetical protein|uniref:hypothetical protein n=1 Tax=Acidisoma sp. S159 TaxID=1747225 RepID=UPI00131AC400|nr:hypothetical protein [Acidisoma sp. S159]
MAAEPDYITRKTREAVRRLTGDGELRQRVFKVWVPLTAVFHEEIDDPILMKRLGAIVKLLTEGAEPHDSTLRHLNDDQIEHLRQDILALYENSVVYAVQSANGSVEEEGGVEDEDKKGKKKRKKAK